jgi:serine/threonine protein kinase
MDMVAGPSLCQSAHKQDFGVIADKQDNKSVPTANLGPGRFTLARLSGSHFLESNEVSALSSQRAATSIFCKFSGPPLLVRVEEDIECLVCYKAPSAIAEPVTDGYSMIGNKSLLEVAACLPLQCATVQAVTEGAAKDRHILRLVLPDPTTVPVSMQLGDRVTHKVPNNLEGNWLLEFETSGALQHLLEQLQLIGCVMRGFAKHYELGQMLGVGSFSKVFYAQHKRTGLPVAAKVVSMTGNFSDDALMTEVCMLRRSCHPSVLKFVGVFSDVDPIDDRSAWIIVTEFVGGGELFERVRALGPLPENRAACIIVQLLSALQSMHKRGIIHRDIKTENVILVDNDEDQVKLVDFGLATQDWDAKEMLRRCGSPGYVAPEVLRSDEYGCKADCFSIGVLLHILLVGRGPFYGKTLEAMLARNMMCKVKRRTLAHLSEEAQDFVLSLLQSEPELRPTAAEALEHPWFQNQAWSKKPPPALTQQLETGPTSNTMIKTGLCAGAQKLQSLKERVDVKTSKKGDVNTSKKGDAASTYIQRNSSLYVEADVDLERSNTHITTCSASRSEPSIECPEADAPMPFGSEGGASNDDIALESTLESMPILRTQTPVFADMQDTLANLRAQGFSPRTSFVESPHHTRQDIVSYRKSGRCTGRFTGHDGARISGRISGRHTGRNTGLERTSAHFTRDPDSDFGNPRDSIHSNASLRELAECDVRRSGKGSDVLSETVEPHSAIWPCGEPREDVLNELPCSSLRRDKRIVHRRVSGEQTQLLHRQCVSSLPTPRSCAAGSCAAGSARAVIRALRPVQSLPASNDTRLECRRDVDTRLEMPSLVSSASEGSEGVVLVTSEPTIPASTKQVSMKAQLLKLRPASDIRASLYRKRSDSDTATPASSTYMSEVSQEILEPSSPPGSKQALALIAHKYGGARRPGRSFTESPVDEKLCWSSEA